MAGVSSSPSADGAADASWLPDAAIAIEVTREWAARVVEETKCQVFLFGSSIYKNGEQFDPAISDLDIVCVYPSGYEAHQRVNILLELRKFKLELELSIIPKLHRISCTEPGVSIVVLTDDELRINVHKSGVRRFFDRNYFYDFRANRARLLEEAGTQHIADENRHALEYVQKIRNDFLSVSANDSGGLLQYAGPDPLPKALLRSAAQLNPDVQDGEWYDTMLGLELIQDRVQKLRSQGGEYLELADRISVRRGARGHERPLTPEQQLLLGEILADEALKTGVENSVTFLLRVVGCEYTPENVKRIFKALLRIAPGAKLTGDRPGSIVLQISAPESTLRSLEDLHKHGALHLLLGVQRAMVVRATLADAPVDAGRQPSREAVLISKIQEWKPKSPAGRYGTEAEFMDFLSEVLVNEPALSGGQVLREVRVDGMPKIRLDFVVSWNDADRGIERLAIEVSSARGSSALFDSLTQFRGLGQTVIFVLLDGEKLVRSVAADLRHYAEINANIKVVAVPAPPRPAT